MAFPRILIYFVQILIILVAGSPCWFRWARRAHPAHRCPTSRDATLPALLHPATALLCRCCPLPSILTLSEKITLKKRPAHPTPPWHRPARQGWSLVPLPRRQAAARPPGRVGRVVRVARRPPPALPAGWAGWFGWPVGRRPPSRQGGPGGSGGLQVTT